MNRIKKLLLRLAPLLFLVGAIGFTVPASAAIAIGAHTSGLQSGGSATLVLPSVNTTTGSTFNVFVGLFGATVTSVTDNESNTYTLITSSTNGGFFNTYAYKCENCTGGTGHVVTILASSAVFYSAYLQEITGALTSSGVDVSNTLTTSVATTFSGASATTTNANDLVLSYFQLQVSYASIADSGAGFSMLDSSTTGGSAVSSAVVSSTGAYSDTYTIDISGNEIGGVIVAYKAASAPPPVVNGVVMSNGHPVQSGTAILYQ